MKTTTISAHTSVAARPPRLAAVATLCLAITATSVHAADTAPEIMPVKKTVTFGDLNLGSPQGVEQLYRRIVAAAQQVCATLDGRSLQEKRQFSICAGQSIARAVSAVDQPALTALQATKTGLPSAAAMLVKR